MDTVMINNAEESSNTNTRKESFSDIVALSRRCETILRSLSLYEAEAREQTARFNIWTTNMGMYSEGRKSLGSRLKDTPKIGDLVQLLLLSLAKDLDRLDKRASGVEAEECEGIRNTQYGAQDELSDCSSTSSYEPFQLDDNDDVSRTIPQATSWTPIQDTITTLHQLAYIVHQAGRDHRRQRIERFKNLGPNKSVYDTFRRCARQKVDHSFPKATEKLRDRMAESIAMRRARFSYLNQHQKKISTLSKPGSSSEEAAAVQQVVPEPTSYLERRFTDDRNLPASKPDIQPSVILSNTVDTKLDPRHFQGSRTKRPESVASVSLSAGGLPRPPKLDATGTSFTCPYCCLIYPAEEATECQWREHLKGDFEPFFCVFDGCDSPFDCGATYTGWITHMRDKHSRTHWRCWYCNPLDSEFAYFSTPQGLEEHVQNCHAKTVTESTRTAFMKHSVLHDPQIFQECPFCGGLPEELERAYPNLEDSQASEALEKHVGNHLSDLAFIMVRINMEETEDGLEDEKSEAQRDVHSRPDPREVTVNPVLTCDRDSCDCKKQGILTSDWTRLDPTFDSMVDIPSGELPGADDDPWYKAGMDAQSEWEFWYPLSLPPGCSRIGPTKSIRHSQDERLRAYFGILTTSSIWTELYQAATEGDYELTVRLLREENVSPDRKDNHGRTPLSLAAENGHEAVVKLLLDFGDRVDVNSKDESGRTPLSLAVENGHEAVVKLLLDFGDRVDVNSKDESGRTPLSLAAENGHEAVVKIIKIAESTFNTGRSRLISPSNASS